MQIPEKEGKATYLVVDDAKGLVALGGDCRLELHVGGARAEKPDEPDQLVFDLDPAPDVRWPRVIASAEEVREFLQELGLKSFVKTSGGKGLHVVAPTHAAGVGRSFALLPVGRPGHRAGRRRTLCIQDVESGSQGQDFRRLPAEPAERDRGGALFDPSQARCAIATPLTWKELPATISSDQFRLANIAHRLDKLRHDPWQEFGELRQSISAAAIRKLD